MSHIEATDQKVFSSLLDESGRVYHLRSQFTLVDGIGTQYLPVNRSYAPLYAAETLVNNIDAPYTKDRVIHDEVSEATALKGREHVIQVAGKDLLFLASRKENPDVQFDPLLSKNDHISGEARRVCELIMKGLARRKVDVEVGVLGSHQTGLNGPESDLDLIMWCPRAEREDVVGAIGDTFKELDYTDPNKTKKIIEYSTRIANLGNLSVRAGEYLARQRLRWISPLGVSTSVQCVHSDYDFQATKQAVDGVLSGDLKVTGHDVQIIVDVLPSSDPFNFPRRWDLMIEDEPAVAIGFDWVHQGMGTSTAPARYIVKAALAENEAGKKVFVLNKPGSYILPLGTAQMIS